MFSIVCKQVLNPTVVRMDILAPPVARKAQPGQFIILRVDAQGERIPLTVAVVGGGYRCLYPRQNKIMATFPVA